ncbi:hypothetical protein [Microvirga sp. G4-2]
MNVPESGLRSPATDAQIKLVQFEKQATIALACIVMLSVAGYALLLQVLP